MKLWGYYVALCCALFFCSNTMERDDVFSKFSVEKINVESVSLETAKQEISKTNFTNANGLNYIKSLQKIKNEKTRKELWASIKKITITDASDIDLTNLTGLEELHILSCKNLDDITNIPASLRTLSIENTNGVSSKNLMLFKNLRYLAFHSCSNVSIDKPLPEFLEEFSVNVCENFLLSTPINKELVKLELIDSIFREPFTLNLASNDKLQIFKLHGCENLILAEGLPKTLRKISILNNTFFAFHFLDLSNCTNLEEASVTQEVSSINLGFNSQIKVLQIYGGKKFSITGKIPQTLECLEMRDVIFANKFTVDQNQYPKLEAIGADDCENIEIISRETK